MVYQWILSKTVSLIIDITCHSIVGLGKGLFIAIFARGRILIVGFYKYMVSNCKKEQNIGLKVL